MSMQTIRVFLIDDHAVLREGLRLLIDAQPGLRVVGETGRGIGAAAAIASAGGADVVVLDISLPDATGIHVAAELRAELPEVRIVALTRHAEKAYVQQLLQNGANGYVLKQTAGDALVTAIRTVIDGGTYLDPAVAGKIADPASTRGVGPTDLTAREREVLKMVAYGHTNKEIAGVLGITVKTVETHKTNSMQKLGITSRADLVRYALAQGWLER
jgi:DNA-binding NarL/FixJ family response regulator